MPANCNPGLRAFMLSLACLAAPLSAAHAADALIVENSDADIVVAVQVRPSGLSGWGPNRLETVIRPGEYAEIDLRVFGDSFCVFDVFIEDADEDWAEYAEADLCLDPVVFYPH